MSRIINNLFPIPACNDYRGGRIPLYGYYFMLVVTLVRASVHFLMPEASVNSLASIIVIEGGNPDPNHLFYLFRADSGLLQMLWVIIYAVVLLRYRNLIPLMFAFLVVECLFSFIVSALHPLDPIYYERTPPEILAVVPTLAFSLIMTWLAVRNATASPYTHR